MSYTARLADDCILECKDLKTLYYACRRELRAKVGPAGYEPDYKAEVATLYDRNGWPIAVMYVSSLSFNFDTPITAASSTGIHNKRC